MNARGERILIFGDSLTHHGSDSAPEAWNVNQGSARTSSAPGDLLASLLLEQGAEAVRTNERVGRSAWNFWSRENADALIANDLAWRPTKVVIMLGTNDADSGVAIDKDTTAMAAIRDAYKNAGAEVWAIGPFTSSIPQARIDAITQMMGKLFGGRFIDGRPLSTHAAHAGDGVHYTAVGARTLALALADALLSKASPKAFWTATTIGMFGVLGIVTTAVVIKRKREGRSLLGTSTPGEEWAEIDEEYAGTVQSLIDDGYTREEARASAEENILQTYPEAVNWRPKHRRKANELKGTNDDDDATSVEGRARFWASMLKGKKTSAKELAEEIDESRKQLAKLFKKKVPAKDAPDYAYQRHCRAIEHEWIEIRSREEALVKVAKKSIPLTERPAACPSPFVFKYKDKEPPLLREDDDFEWGQGPKPDGYDERKRAREEHVTNEKTEWAEYKARGFWGAEGGEGYRVAYGLVTKRDGEVVTVRAIVDAPRALTLEEAEKWRRQHAKQTGNATWIETMDGKHVPVKGAMKFPKHVIGDQRPGEVHASLLKGTEPDEDDQRAGEDEETWWQRLINNTERKHARMREALDTNDAVILDSYGRKILLLKTPEMSNTSEGKFRVTAFDEDGPIGHTTRETIAEIAEEMSRDWNPKSITPASEEDVLAITSTERFAEGSRRVVEVQRANAGLKSASKAPQEVSVHKLFAWQPKVEETIVDVAEGRTSRSNDKPIVVSRLDTPRGGFWIVDGHHRAVEAVQRGDTRVRIIIDENVPRIERTGGAYADTLRRKVNVAQAVKR